MQWNLYPATEFPDFADRWDKLNLKTANSILLDSRFVSSLLNYFSNGQEQLVVLTEERETRAMGIISKLGLGKWASFQPSQAPIGCWLQESALSVVEILAQLSRQLPGFTMVFSITQQDPNLLPRPINIGRLLTLDYIETAKITIHSSFDSYWSQRSKNLRQGLRRQRNKLARENIQTRLLAIRNPKEVAGAIATYGNIESAGWKARNNTAIHKDNVQGHFYRELLESFFDTNQGVIYQYWYNNQIVATDLCIHDNKAIVILKTTYDEAIRDTSPAMLMRQESFQEIFDNWLVSEIEFYGKVMDWHRKWSTEIRCMYHINFYAKYLNSIAALRTARSNGSRPVGT